MNSSPNNDNLFFAQENTERDGEEYFHDGYLGGYYMNENDDVSAEYSYGDAQQEYRHQEEQTFEEPQASATGQNLYSGEVSTSTEESSAGTKTGSAAGSPKPISSVDARVLESILMEGKLDLSTEEEVKKLLKGPRMKEEEDDGAKKAGEGKGKNGRGEYSSKFVSVSDVSA